MIRTDQVGMRCLPTMKRESREWGLVVDSRVRVTFDRTCEVSNRCRLPQR
jgi:hypothetical protein